MLRDRLPQDVLTIIYTMDPTFRERYHDIGVYVQSKTFHYVPYGIHSLVFFPKYWAVETDLPLEVDSQKRQYRILRFFLSHQEFQEYTKNLHAMTRSVDWKIVESFMLTSFLSL